jgi:hypothetical protein
MLMKKLGILLLTPAILYTAGITLWLIKGSGLWLFLSLLGLIYPFIISFTMTTVDESVDKLMLYTFLPVFPILAGIVLYLVKGSGLWLLLTVFGVVCLILVPFVLLRTKKGTKTNLEPIDTTTVEADEEKE